jgi:hypothetical protein
MADITFRTSRGGDPVAHIKLLKKAVEITAEDLLYAGQRQRSRIVERTRAGVDVDKRPFHRYSTGKPYYYNPTGSQKGRSWESRQAAVTRIMRKIGGTAKGGKTPWIVRSAGGKVVAEVRGAGDTIRFRDYATFKRWLGRSVVDLTGPRAPHMLQAIMTKVQGVKELILGIYGQKADIAQGHNEGANHLPKRHFFGASSADLKQMACDIGDRMAARMKRA